MAFAQMVAAILRAPAGVMTRVLSPARFALLNILETIPLFLNLFRKPLIASFNKTYYYLRCNTIDNTRFMGKHVLKFPTDLWAYQEIIFEHRPDVIVETGVFLGGGTYYFSKLCQLFGHGRVIAVDITLDHTDPELASLPNVTLIEGDSTAPATLERVRALISPGEKVMVVLDSDHTAESVQAEMALFSQLVSEGQYLVVEDGIVDRVYPFWVNRGPLTAIKRFLHQNSDFQPDYFHNRFLLTQNPSGFLLRVGGDVARRPQFPTPEGCLRPSRLWLPGQGVPGEIKWLGYLNQNRANTDQRTK